MTNRLLTPLLALALLGVPSAAAQRFGLSVGYTRMAGHLGDFNSDEGLTVRLGAELNPKSILRFGFEASLQHLNEARQFNTTTCFHPAGGLATCYFSSKNRDNAWSIAAVLRGGPKVGTVRPYALIGVEVLSVRTHGSSVAFDSTGAHLSNFEYDGTTTDGALGAPLGAGILIRPAGSPISIMLEGRASLLFHGYDGGPNLDWNPSLVLGVRFGG